jgi:starch phosphorylase
VELIMEADLAALKEIALDLRWSWNHAADELWRMLEPELWELTQNAWVVLQTVSQKRLDEAFADPAFRSELEEVLRERKEAAERTRWFASTQKKPLSAVAYFSMEFMLSEALPIYSGGLGNVAGDQLKAADDLGVPVIGVGLLYNQGYFRQHIDAAGNQLALRPVNDPGQLPVAAVRDESGEWLRIPIALPGARLWVRTWCARVGQRRLYLLDTNDPANLPEQRGITSELYGGGPELRLEQERILGIAGWRLLRSLGIRPEVCHLNEGHAAFAVLERARDFMRENNTSFPAALAATRAGNIFTTHTPVAAGFDQFAPDLVALRMREYAESELGISLHDFLALGRMDSANDAEPFNMAYLAVRGSGAVNGVSRLHGQVSRRIFQGLFPRWPEAEVPVSHITNGVHTPTWDSEPSDELWTKACGKGRWTGTQEQLEESVRKVPAIDIWRMRNAERRALVDSVRRQLARQIAGHGGSRNEIETARRVLDPDTLTLGFARRFATYKRPDLLLRDPDRLLRILTNHRAPVQLILAGKAHPQDYEGQQLVRRWIEFIRGTAARSQAVFLSDYDMRMAQQLVQGVDLWLNTPRRPWEASGTSGMKVLANGGLNFSELDGWWAEAYSSDVGWALGDGREHDSDPRWDDAEAQRLYDLLEREIIPAFYTRDESGIPAAWMDRVRESMARLTPVFSANRAVREYTEEHYIPAAEAYCQRAKDGGRIGADIVKWRQQVEDHWPRLRFGSLRVDSKPGEHEFTVQAALDDLPPDFVTVELVANGAPGAEPIVEKMTRGPALPGSQDSYPYTATLKTNRPAGDFTPRIVPAHPSAIVPLECAAIIWYR